MPLLFFIFFAYKSDAQDIENNLTDEKESEEYAHEHHRNEIGLSCAPVFFVNEDAWSYGLHLHYIYAIKGSNFGVGAGAERIFDEHGHNTFGLIARYSPVDKVNLMLSPGVVFESANPDEVKFVLHTEASYEFEIDDFHIGPALDFAYAAQDFHISLGLHLGYGF
ncbi:MAG: hypothetical protein LC116_06200 [Bacteroidetes bacterium]|nr:hypothetical protein [Bacteroidota bacterium]MCZ2132771.1 hypothetical protein [Bacteroidota bacterium]